MPLMLRALRSRRFAFLALAAFLLAQPAMGCAALCLFQQHHGQHEMAGMGGSAATGSTACHTGVADADHHGPLQALSPMMPARAHVIAAVPSEAVEPLDLSPTLPPLVSRTVEPPPPRLV
ncbi:MAG: hypothetical protein ACREOQ_02915 [Gemmatimonadales bacterium]